MKSCDDDFYHSFQNQQRFQVLTQDQSICVLLCCEFWNYSSLCEEDFWSYVENDLNGGLDADFFYRFSCNFESSRDLTWTLSHYTKVFLLFYFGLPLCDASSSV